MTLLIEAAKAGDLETVNRLIEEKQIDIDAGDNTRRSETALMWAVRNGHLKVCEALLQAGADIMARDIIGDTAVVKAVYSGQLNILRAFMGYRKFTPQELRDTLNFKFIKGDLSIACFLIEMNPAIVNMPNTRSGNYPLHEAVFSEDLKVVKYLVSQGASLTQLNEFAETPLTYCSYNPSPRKDEILLYLMEVEQKEKEAKHKLQMQTTEKKGHPVSENFSMFCEMPYDTGEVTFSFFEMKELGKIAIISNAFKAWADNDPRWAVRLKTKYRSSIPGKNKKTFLASPEKRQSQYLHIDEIGRKYFCKNNPIERILEGKLTAKEQASISEIDAVIRQRGVNETRALRNHVIRAFIALNYMTIQQAATCGQNAITCLNDPGVRYFILSGRLSITSIINLRDHLNIDSNILKHLSAPITRSIICEKNISLEKVFDWIKKDLFHVPLLCWQKGNVPLEVAINADFSKLSLFMESKYAGPFELIPAISLLRINEKIPLLLFKPVPQSSKEYDVRVRQHTYLKKTNNENAGIERDIRHFSLSGIGLFSKVTVVERNNLRKQSGVSHINNRKATQHTLTF